jgi:hypothetical protein
VCLDGGHDPTDDGQHGVEVAAQDTARAPLTPDDRQRLDQAVATLTPAERHRLEHDAAAGDPIARRILGLPPREPGDDDA